MDWRRLTELGPRPRMRILVWIEREDGSEMLPLFSSGANPSEALIGAPTVTEVQAGLLALLAISYDACARDLGMPPRGVAPA